MDLFSITTASASGKHRCPQSLEIQIHLLDHVQEGEVGVSRDVTGEGWLSGHKPRGTHKSCQFPEARRSNGSQVRDPPAARRLDAIKQWPPEVLKVGVSGSLHPGSNLCPMPALSLCVCLYISLSSALLSSLPPSLSPFFPFFIPSPLLFPPFYVQQSEASEPKPWIRRGHHFTRERGVLNTWLMHIGSFETQGILLGGDMGNRRGASD